MATQTYIPLATLTITTPVNAVTFSNIDQNYGDLILISKLDDAAGGTASIEFKFNNSTADQSTVYMQAFSNGNFQSETRSSFFVTSTDNAFFRMEIFDYSATDKHKSLLIRSHKDEPDFIKQQAARWAQTAALTSLEIYDNGGANFAAGSTFSLYGIAK